MSPSCPPSPSPASQGVKVKVQGENGEAGGWVGGGVEGVNGKLLQDVLLKQKLL